MLKLDLLNTETEASLYRLEGALDSSEDCLKSGAWNAFTMGEYLFHRKQTVTLDYFVRYYRWTMTGTVHE